MDKMNETHKYTILARVLLEVEEPTFENYSVPVKRLHVLS